MKSLLGDTVSRVSVYFKISYLKDSAAANPFAVSEKLKLYVITGIESRMLHVGFV